MKKHDILFQAQEEAFIQALEEEMARETPDPNAIRAILDQLPRPFAGPAGPEWPGWRLGPESPGPFPLLRLG